MGAGRGAAGRPRPVVAGPLPRPGRAPGPSGAGAAGPGGEGGGTVAAGPGRPGGSAPARAVGRGAVADGGPILLPERFLAQLLAGQRAVRREVGRGGGPLPRRRGLAAGGRG